MNPDHSATTCPHCGAKLQVHTAQGLCPKCLLAQAALPTEVEAPASGPDVPSLQDIALAFPELEVIEFIGRGGMGVVYKARQKSLNRLIALKLLAPERVQDPMFAERFTREAQALATLSHPNIVTVHDFGQASGFYFLLMEFVDGVNLRQAMSAGRFTPDQALAIVPPVCEALQYAHDHGIVHRDIKPENLLLDKDGRVKIADFGIAKMLDVDRTEEVSQPAGTPRYMAPEQAGQKAVDHRADIYSLGVVLYELLTGEAPDTRLTPPSRRVQVDVRLDEVVLRALNEKPELRWQTAAELKTQVQTITALLGRGDLKEEDGSRLRPSDDRSKWQAWEQRLQAWGFNTRWGTRMVGLSILGVAVTTGSFGTHDLIFGLLLVVSLMVFVVPQAWRGWWRKPLKNILVALLVVVPLRSWFVQTYMVKGVSIEPEIPQGSHMLVWKFGRDFSPGDIIAYKHGDQTWVGRVVLEDDEKATVQRNGTPEEDVPKDLIIGKVVSVYWRAAVKTLQVRSQPDRSPTKAGPSGHSQPVPNPFTGVAWRAMTVRQQLELALGAMRPLANMERGRRYELPAAGKPKIGQNDDFLRLRTGREVLDSGLSCGCGDHALAFIEMLKPTGLECWIVDGPEISLRALETSFSGHVVVAVRKSSNDPWFLCDPTARQVMDERWSATATSFYDGRFWIGFAGPLENYPVRSPQQVKQFLSSNLAKVPREVFNQRIMRLRFTLDPGLFNDQGHAHNPVVKQAMTIQDDLLNRFNITPEREVEVRLVDGDDDAAGRLSHDKERGFICTVGRQSGFSAGFLDYMNSSIQAYWKKNGMPR